MFRAIAQQRPQPYSVAAIKAHPPKAVFLIAVLVFFIGGIGPNAFLAFLAVCVLVLGVSLLWRPGEPPIFLLLFGMQWLQVSIGTFQANLLGIDINKTVEFDSDVWRAVLLSLFGLAFLAVGIRVGAGRWRLEFPLFARQIAARYPVSAFFRLYAIAFAAAFFSEGLAHLMPGLSQPFLAVTCVKWAFFWLLGYSTFCQRGSRKAFFIAAFLLELGWGLGGFFSDFKTVFFVSFLALAAANVRISPSTGIGLTVVAILVLIFGVIWSAIKPEYRAYVSGGEHAQIVSVGFSDRMTKLGELVSALDREALADGADRLVKRLSYVEFFGAVLLYVPTMVPHEQGAIWWDAITRPFMPRLLFPGKAIIDDSERTNKYTGLGISGSDVGASISIGYLGESYIDFGEVGMMAPIFLLGVFLGGAYRWLITMSYTRGVLGYGLAIGVLLGGLFAETSITKSAGGFIVSLLVVWLIAKYAGPRVFPWLQLR